MLSIEGERATLARGLSAPRQLFQLHRSSSPSLRTQRRHRFRREDGSGRPRPSGRGSAFRCLTTNDRRQRPPPPSSDRLLDPCFKIFTLSLERKCAAYALINSSAGTSLTLWLEAMVNGKGERRGRNRKRGGGAQAECGGGCWEKEKSEEGQRSTSFFLLPFSPLSLSLPVSFFLSLSLSLCQPRSNQQRQRKVEKHNECRNEWYV